MYSLILMTAMAGTPDVASFGWDYVGCYGSCGGISVGCSGYAPASCYGCCGGYGPLFPRAAALARFTARATVGTIATVLRPFSCYGCYGSSYYGSSCYGSSCYGSSCYGSSCYGSSCYGSSCLGSTSYYGSAAYGGCYGSSYSIGGPSYSPTYVPSYSAYPMTTPSMVVESTEGYPETISRQPVITIPTPEVSNPVVTAKAVEPVTTSVANIAIEIPENAKLYVDGKLVSGSGEKRQFHTPALPKGQAFYYDMKAEIEVNGHVEVEQKRVVLRGGDELKESFPKLFAAIRSSSRDSIASK